MVESIKAEILEAIAGALPETPLITTWIETGAVTDLTEQIVDIIKKHLDEE